MQNPLKIFSSTSFQDLKKIPHCAVILAGGDGTRLKSLTRSILGDDRPKQFCPILNSETLIEMTRKRVELKIARPNIFYSLTRKHESFYAPLLSHHSGDRLIVQPENKGTAAAILYSLLRVAISRPNAIVTFFPSDHYFADDEGFMKSVDNAYRTVTKIPESVVLFGIIPDSAETSYGWIEPASPFNQGSPVSSVKKFWEKPSFEIARTLLENGCVWNSFVMTGRVDTFLGLFRKYLPDLFRIFTAASVNFSTRAERETVTGIYDWIAEQNFSSDILEKCSGELLVTRVKNVGWSDWGEPNRVLGTLSQLGIRTTWMQSFAA